MSVFGDYSAYYDLLYSDKNYMSEAQFIHNLIRKYHPGAKTVLDLGCGTGRHDYHLSEKGYSVHGIDLSDEMISIAKKMDNVENLTFSRGDIREIRLGRTFDVVVSLFHVMSYMTGNKDLRKAFETVNHHLDRDGLFIFDCWYGPAVITNKPSVRVKRLENEQMAITRIAEPAFQPNNNLVEVNYEIITKDKLTGNTANIREVHRMRYLFMPEIKDLLESNNLKLVFCCEWMTGKEPGFDTWSTCFGGRKI